MAGIILAIVEPLLRKLGEYLVNPIKNQVLYLCCYSCNVETLTQEVPKLNTRKESVQQDVDAAKHNLEVIRPEVQSWLSEVEEVQRKSSEISNDAAGVQKSCLSKWCPLLHYSLSREAQKTNQASIELRNTSFERISNPVNPADLEPVPATYEIGFKSRDSIEKEIMEALKDESVYLIGICGMGGIGKTTMAKKIEKKAREKTEDLGSMFEHVLMVVVSQQLDLPKLQQQIAEGLGLRLDQDSVTIRARLLHKRLTAEKNLLIILDDVWERLNLEEIGIPSQSTNPGCKLILTSRNRNALCLTEGARIFSLKVLSDEESWILFRKNAGNLIDSPDLHQIAKDVVKECKGLPLALVAVGRALRDRRKPSWEDALLGLRLSMPRNIPVVLKDVYRPLLWSFNQLESEEYRYLFLLCCLFPEDSLISLETLVVYGMGLGIFEGTECLRQARNRVESIVENLFSRFLLIESSDDWGVPCVKMHDVIRDMGIWIASEPEGNHVFMISHGKEEWPIPKEDAYGNYTCISLVFSDADIVVPECVDCPRLEFLRMDFAGGNSKLPENFFSRMRRLKVLRASGIESLPSSIHLLDNLRTLHLLACKLEMTSMIGELIHLEILRLNDCAFEVLPKEIGKLKKLRRLEVINCFQLRRIAFGAVSGLARLEELVLVGSFRNWEAEENDNEINNNASLVELDSLSHLTTLHIEISDPNVIPKRIPHWVQKVMKYSINVSGITSFYDLKFQKAIVVGEEEATPLRDWFYDMARDAEYLDLKGSSCRIGVNKLVRSGYQNLKHFRLNTFNNVQYLSNAIAEGQQNGAIFPFLEYLRIEDSSSLQEISDGAPSVGSFGALKDLRLVKLSRLVHFWTFSNKMIYLSNLQDLHISDCESLLYLFSLPIAGSLSQLKNLRVSNCEVMEEIFKKGEGGMEITINKINFPKLSYLNLDNLPSLYGFCNAVDGIEAPKLSELRISNLASIIREGDHDVHQQIFFDQQVAGNSLEIVMVTPLGNFNFNWLQRLTIDSLHNFKSLFSPSILCGVPNLKDLQVENCSKLEEVIGKEEKVEEIETKRTLFPQLITLFLRRLPKILAFCHSKSDLELPSLRSLVVKDCPTMETFVQGFSDEHINQLEMPSLRALFIEDCPTMEAFVRGLSNEHAKQPFFGKVVAGNSSKFVMLTPLGNFNFGWLQTLTIDSLHNFKSLFSPSILCGIPNLTDLSVHDCSKLEEVIGKEEKVEEIKTKRTLFPRLTTLTLVKLPMIFAFCHCQSDLELPSLQELSILDCPTMETFVRGFSDEHVNQLELPSLQKLFIVFCPMMETFIRGLSNEHANQPFFGKEVFCPQLKSLQLNNLNTARIFNHDIPTDNFCGLKELEIKSCHKIINLFSPSIFRGLTNITRLSLVDCEEVQEVIAKEDREEGPTCTKETLSPQLHYLCLQALPRMYRFCHLNHDLEFPSLETVTIDNCPVLETFSWGSLYLPNFKFLRGLLDPDFAAKFFFNKEKSSHEIHSENYCFSISARDLSIKVEDNCLSWFLLRDSSDSFVIAAEVSNSWSLEIIGKFEIIKLSPGVVYEIIFMIMLEDYALGWEEPVNLKLTLPGGITQHGTENLNETPRGEGIEIVVGEFMREPDQIGQLEFSLFFQAVNLGVARLLLKGVVIKGVTIQRKV